MSKSIEVTGLINGQLYGFRMFPRNLKGQYQTETDGATATATPQEFAIPTYTGNHSIFGNETEGRIEMYTSGTLTLYPSFYDVYAVGGGGAGEGKAGDYSGNGGGSGYTAKSSKIINEVKELAITIGSGAMSMTGNGGDTTIMDTSSNITWISAKGGYGGSRGADGTIFSGGDGGSGGGGGAYQVKAGDGGSDGSDGGRSGQVASKGGKGQGTTTRDFGEVTGTLRAGGGGAGGSGSNQRIGLGGAGGGGNGFYVDQTLNQIYGTPNTGGGGGGSFTTTAGAGGSGIAIIRWKRN